MKVRKKPCRHCLFTKCHLGKNIEELRGQALQAPKPFQCHEHTEQVICNGYYARIPENVPDPQKINYNGDLKSKFSQMSKPQQLEYNIVT